MINLIDSNDVDSVHDLYTPTRIETLVAVALDKFHSYSLHTALRLEAEPHREQLWVPNIVDKGTHNPHNRS